MKGVSFKANAGEFVSIVGRNGSGKSTLVELLAGLIVPDSGDIGVLDVDMRRDPTRALSRIGFVFQQSTLDLELSVRGNLGFHAGLHGLDPAVARRRIDEVLERFDLTQRAGAKTRTLSGGNRRRLELARALLTEPAILILDEPTVGLDPGIRKELVEHALELTRNSGLLVLWTTHLVEEAEKADRLLVMSAGSLTFDGTPAQALEKTGSVELQHACEKLAANSFQ